MAAAQSRLFFDQWRAGANAAVLTVTSSTLGVEPVRIPMIGIGQAASGLTISPAELAFTEPVVGSPSPPQLATITNTSKAAADGLTLSTTGPFSLTQNACGTSLAVGASCTTGIVFTPIADGVAIGTLTVSSSSVANPAVAALTGIGGAAGTVLIQPSLLKFSATGVGTVSSTQLVTVTNSSAVVLSDLGSQCIQWIPGYRHHLRLAPRAGCKLHGDGYLCARKCRPADRVSDN